MGEYVKMMPGVGIKKEGGVAVSAGVVAFKESGGRVKVLVVRGIAGEHPDLGFYGLPKGLVHEGEADEEAAARDTREETGFRTRVGGYVGSTRYENEFGPKEARYFLAEFAGGKRGKPDGEFVWTGWVPVATALRGLTYKSDREILQKALDKLG